MRDAQSIVNGGQNSRDFGVVAADKGEDRRPGTAQKHSEEAWMLERERLLQRRDQRSPEWLMPAGADGLFDQIGATCLECTNQQDRSLQVEDSVFIRKGRRQNASRM